MYGLGALPDDLSQFYGDDELMGGGGESFAIRLNNPGNINRSSIQWQGMSPEQNSRFVSFLTPEDGIRAMSKNLDAFVNRHGLDTLRGITKRWAPAGDGDNDPDAYAQWLGKQLGVDPDAPLPMTDPQFKAALMAKMANAEAGQAAERYSKDAMLRVIGGPNRVATATAPEKKATMQNLGALDSITGKLMSDEEAAPMRDAMTRSGVDSVDKDAMMRMQSGGAGVSAIPAPPQRTGLSGLSPYLQIAAQLMPERQGSGWGDALINAGAAMMQSRSPDFLGAAGAGLAAGNQALQARRGQDRQDVMDRFKFGMGLAQFDQKDAGEYAMSDGVLYNKKTGLTQQVGGAKAQSDIGKLQSDLAAGRISPDEYQIGLAKIRGENESPAMKVIRELGLDPRSPEARKILNDYAQQVGGARAQSDIGKLQSDLAAGRINAEEYQVGVAKLRGENESPALKAIRELGLDPKSPAAQKILNDYALRVGGGTTTNVDLRGEGKFAEETAKGEAAVYNDIKKGAMEAPQSNARLDRLGNLLEDVQTGKFATSLSELQKGLNSILGTENAPKVFGKAGDVAKAEAAQALAREIALSLRNPAGGAGMPGALSDSDRRFLESMTPGLETTAQGRKIMIDTAKALNKRNVEVARLAQQYVKDNGGRFTGFEVYMADWAEKNPLFSAPTKEAAPAPAAAPPPPNAAAPTPPAESLKVTTPTMDGTGTKTQDVPIKQQGIPTFASPSDPEFAKLPSGSVFYDGNGVMRLKP